MINLMITAPASNSGKTAVSCGLMALLKDRGLKTCAFKCGPDYIDPMFHRSVMGIPGRNLDVFMAGEEGVKASFANGSAGCDAAVCEGVMGYFDGFMPGSDTASAWHLSEILDLPALLVVRPRGSALTLAAVIRGMAEFRRQNRIVGVILNDCSEIYCRTYKESLEKESGIPILGYLPPMEEARFESRHLGLMTSEEIDDLSQRIGAIGRKMEETVDIDHILRVCERTDDGEQDFRGSSIRRGSRGKRQPEEDRHPVIAVARDAAFSFIYEESIEALQGAGADIRFFSPIVDSTLPEGAAGIYLPGGYPELYGRELSENRSMKEAICNAVAGGMPVIAECGGFMYLSDKLTDDKGRSWDMAGIFPGKSENAGHLVRFGYGYISAKADSLLLRRGEKIPVHEFHYWDTDSNGTDMHFAKAYGNRNWDFGFASDSMYAGFPHLYLAGNDGLLARRFVEAAGR